MITLWRSFTSPPMICSKLRLFILVIAIVPPNMSFIYFVLFFHQESPVFSLCNQGRIVRLVSGCRLLLRAMWLHVPCFLRQIAHCTPNNCPVGGQSWKFFGRVFARLCSSLARGAAFYSFAFARSISAFDLTTTPNLSTSLKDRRGSFSLVPRSKVLQIFSTLLSE